MVTRKTWLSGVVALGVGGVLGSTALGQAITVEMVLNLAQSMGAFDVQAHPKFEKIENDEAENIKRIAVSMFQIQMATSPETRDAHAKGHGCAEAKFEIAPNLPAQLRVGLFAEPGKSFDAIVRFSNGAGVIKADAPGDGRGMAIKVLNAQSEMNLLNTGHTQDFLLINNPRFFTRSVKDYASFERALVETKKPDRFFLERAIREALQMAGFDDSESVPDANVLGVMQALGELPQNPSGFQAQILKTFPQEGGAVAERVGKAVLTKVAQLKAGAAPLELKIAKELSKSIQSSLPQSYFSMSSYLLSAGRGTSSDLAVKYVVRPVNCSTRERISDQLLSANQHEDARADHLRENLAQSLRDNGFCYDFYLKVLPESLSSEKRIQAVEDTRIDFEGREVLAARMVLPRQESDLAERNSYCENLSFNPWQAGREHRPLGAMNRARKAAVTASSIRRHLVRGVGRSEPASIEELRSAR